MIRAVEAALVSKMHTIALTGRGGRLGKITKVAISVPSTETQHIQEAHLSIEHILCALVEQDMFGKGEPGKEQAQ